MKEIICQKGANVSYTMIFQK